MSIPIVRMAAIPVIADTSVFYRPVVAQTDKDVFAMIVWINISESEVRAAVVVNEVAISRPDYSVVYPTRVASMSASMVMNVSYRTAAVTTSMAWAPVYSVVFFAAVNKCIAVTRGRSAGRVNNGCIIYNFVSGVVYHLSVSDTFAFSVFRSSFFYPWAGRCFVNGF